MKKRLLFVLAIGIAFAPAVFADGGAIGAFTRSNTAGQSFCQAGITRTKSLDTAQSDDQGSSSSKASSVAGDLAND